MAPGVGGRADLVAASLATSSPASLERLYKHQMAELHASSDEDASVAPLVHAVLCLSTQLQIDGAHTASILAGTAQVHVLSAALSVVGSDPSFVQSVVRGLLHQGRGDLLRLLASSFRSQICDALWQLGDADLVAQAIACCPPLLGASLATRVPVSAPFFFHAMAASETAFKLFVEHTLLQSSRNLSQFALDVLDELATLDALDEAGVNCGIAGAFRTLAPVAAQDDPACSGFANYVLIGIGRTSRWRALEAIAALLECVSCRSSPQIATAAFLEMRRAAKITLSAVCTSQVFTASGSVALLVHAFGVLARFVPRVPSYENDQLWMALLHLLGHVSPHVVRVALHLLRRLPVPSMPSLHWPMALSLLGRRRCELLQDCGRDLQPLGAVASIEAALLDLCSPAPDARSLTIAYVFQQLVECGSLPTYAGCHDVAFLRRLITSGSDDRNAADCLLGLVREQFQVGAGFATLEAAALVKSSSFVQQDLEVVADLDRNPWLLDACVMAVGDGDISPIADLIRAVLVFQIRDWSRPPDTPRNVRRSQRLLRALWAVRRIALPAAMQIVDCSLLIPFITPPDAAALLTAVLDRLRRAGGQYDESDASHLIRLILFQHVDRGPLADLLHRVLSAR